MFSDYGEVISLEHHYTHRDKLYVVSVAVIDTRGMTLCKLIMCPSVQIMDDEGGRTAMASLNGFQLLGSPRPLSVQEYVSYNSNKL